MCVMHHSTTNQQCIQLGRIALSVPQRAFHFHSWSKQLSNQRNLSLDKLILKCLTIVVLPGKTMVLQNNKDIHLHSHSSLNVSHIVSRILPTLCLTKADNLGNLLTIYSHFFSYFLRKQFHEKNIAKMLFWSNFKNFDIFEMKIKTWIA